MNLDLLKARTYWGVHVLVHICKRSGVGVLVCNDVCVCQCASVSVCG